MIEKLDMGKVLTAILNAAVRRQGLTKVKEVLGLSGDFQTATVLMADGKKLEMEAAWANLYDRTRRNNERRRRCINARKWKRSIPIKADRGSIFLQLPGLEKSIATYRSSDLQTFEKAAR